MNSLYEQVYHSHATTNEIAQRLASVECIMYELGLSETTSNRVEDLSSDVEALSTNVRLLQSSTAKDCSALRNQLVNLTNKYEEDANSRVVAANGLRQDLHNMTSYFLAGICAFKLHNSHLGTHGAFAVSQFSQLQGISAFFREHGGAFIEDSHNEMGSKFSAVHSAAENDLQKQYVQPVQSLAECRKEHDDISVFSWEDYKKISYQKYNMRV